MAKIITDVDDAIIYINTLYDSDSSAPAEGEEDYTVWLSLLNVAKDIWENEEGIMWRELFVKLADAATGDKTTATGDYSYACPTDFRFEASGYVWLGGGTSKRPIKVIPVENVQLFENDISDWCYFTRDATPTLEFNPNMSMPDGYTISYNYYKNASGFTLGTDTFEMSDPMYAVYYVVSELRRDEGDTSAAAIATQKLEGMKTRNQTPAWYQENTAYSPSDDGLGV